MLLAISASISAVDKPLNAALAPILSSELRADGNRSRDRYRHPAETLAFFELGSRLTVVEIWPGPNGWYTEILAPLLREQGQLVCAHWGQDSGVPFFQEARLRFDTKLAAAPDYYDRVLVTVLEPTARMAIAPAASADRVLTFRNVHNWLKAGSADAVFAAMYAALKPGGLLGVVEHRAVAGTTDADMNSSGYVTESRVVQLAEKAGLEYVASSEINANPKDDSHHPKGVWSLPPTLRGGDTDRSVYLAIGESDRMTMKFRKPRAAD
jgi:predicted methyltransferase